MFQHTAARRRLSLKSKHWQKRLSFNTQPPEGGWRHLLGFSDDDLVSTHSRPKAAGKSY